MAGDDTEAHWQPVISKRFRSVVQNDRPPSHELREPENRGICNTPLAERSRSHHTRARMAGGAATLAFATILDRPTGLTGSKTGAYTATMVSLAGTRSATVMGSAVLLLTGGLFARVAAQSVEREMVVSVFDENGRPVTGLTASDFLVREDGAAREVLRVGSASRGRQIALLVDTSEAAAPVVSDLRRGVETFVDAMIAGNEISLIAVSGPPRILTASTSSATRLKDGIGDIFAFPGSASYLLDAARDTARGFSRQNAAQPIIIAMTTLGVDYSNRGAQSTIEELVKAGAAFYSIVFTVGRSPVSGGIANTDREIAQRRLERDRFLSAGPTETGGRRRELQSGSAAERVMSDLATDLRNQYMVVYSRPNTLIPPERIEVELTGDNDSLDARGTPVLTDR